MPHLDLSDEEAAARGLCSTASDRSQKASTRLKPTLARRSRLALPVGVRLIVWCKARQHQVEPDPAEMARQGGAETSVLDWRERLVCSRCGGRQADMVVSCTKKRGSYGGVNMGFAHLEMLEPGTSRKPAFNIPLRPGATQHERTAKWSTNFLMENPADWEERKEAKRMCYRTSAASITTARSQFNWWTRPEELLNKALGGQDQPPVE